MKPAAEAPAASHFDLKYRRDIDGLRAIAVLSVVVYHAFPGVLRGGFIGVDIFFVISGYLISTIILQNLAGAGFSYHDFYARRIRRIAPALVLVIGATFAFGWFVLLADEFRQLGKHVLASAGFVANLVLWGEAGYFDVAAEIKPLLHLWSLAVEEQFYIFWPLLLGLAWRRPGRRMLLWMGLAAAASFVLNVAGVHRHPDATFYSPLSRVWELAAGALLAQWSLRRGAGLESMASGVAAELRSALGLLFIVVGLFVINRNKAFPGNWALLPVLGACLCISAGGATWLGRRVLGAAPMVWLGLISYPLYLWHWPLLVFARVVEGGTPSRNLRLACVAAAIALAWLTYHGLERRLRRRGGRWVVPGLSLAMVALALLGALAFGQWMAPRHSGAGLQAIASASTDWTYPAGLQRARLGGRDVYQVGSGKPQVLLVGDSHVEQFAPRAVALASSEPGSVGRLIFGTRGACPPIPDLFEDRDPGCGERRADLLTAAHGPDVDTVVLGACWSCYFDVAEPSPASSSSSSPSSGPSAAPASAPSTKAPASSSAASTPAPDAYYVRAADGSRHMVRGGDGLPLALASLERLIGSLRTAGKRVYLLLPIPVGHGFEPGQRIGGSRLGTLTVLPLPPSIAMPPSQRRLHDRLAELAARSGAIAIDPLPTLCSADDQCRRSDAAGVPIYIKDGAHLTARYVREHADFLDPALKVAP